MTKGRGTVARRPRRSVSVADPRRSRWPSSPRPPSGDRRPRCATRVFSSRARSARPSPRAVAVKRSMLSRSPRWANGLARRPPPPNLGAPRSARRSRPTAVRRELRDQVEARALGVKLFGAVHVSSRSRTEAPSARPSRWPRRAAVAHAAIPRDWASEKESTARARLCVSCSAASSRASRGKFTRAARAWLRRRRCHLRAVVAACADVQ